MARILVVAFLVSGASGLDQFLNSSVEVSGTQEKREVAARPVTISCTSPPTQSGYCQESDCTYTCPQARPGLFCTLGTSPQALCPEGGCQTSTQYGCAAAGSSTPVTISCTDVPTPLGRCDLSGCSFSCTPPSASLVCPAGTRPQIYCPWGGCGHRSTPYACLLSHQENCSTTVEGEECYHAVLWAKHHGIALHPEWYNGLTHHSSFEEFQSLLSRRGMFACKRPCNLCHTAEEGERCHEEVTWAMLHGIRENPQWYLGLTSGASFEEFQSHLHNSGYSSCPEPCDLCRSVVEGEQCYTDVAWAMEHGIGLHPEWYTGLTRNSTREEFQAYLSDKFDCPRACGLCHTATAGEPCHEGVLWAMLHGIKLHPEWYPDLSQNSSFEAFQEHLHEGKFMNCPRPCQA